MRLRTIWTIPAMSFMERMRRTRDWLSSELGSRLPLRMRYWVTLQEIGKATRKSEDIPATPLEDVLRNLEKPRSLS